MSKGSPPAPTASAIDPCPTIIQIVGCPELEVYPGPSHHLTIPRTTGKLTILGVQYSSPLGYKYRALKESYNNYLLMSC